MGRKICEASRLCLLVAGIFLFGVARPLSADFRFTLTGDPRSSYSKWAWTLNQIADKVGDEGAFHITAGDYYEDGGLTVAAGFYERLVAQFGADVVWYPTVGNHELEEGGPDMVWLRNFYYVHLEGTVNPGPANGEETTYSWDYQNAHFVQLNQYYDGTTDDADIDEYTDALYNWLVEDLDRNTKPVVFVIYHKPTYPNGRGDKDSDEGWERLLKLLNDRKVIAGLCADTHTYARYQVDGDWETFTWELDSGNAGRLSHGDLHQTFVDITVSDDGTVQFVTWQGMENEGFTVTDAWTAAAVMAQLVGPADGATVDVTGAVLSCEAIPGEARYQLVFGPDPNHMVYLVSETPEPPTEVLTTFPFGETWWNLRIRTSAGHTIHGVPRHVHPENVTPIVIENLSNGKRYGYIQEAVDDAVTGDAIVVGETNWQRLENINIQEKSLILRSVSPLDPAVVARTVINGGDWAPAVTLSGFGSADCMLQGFTITGGSRDTGRGSGILFDGTGPRGNPTISDCMIIENDSNGIHSVDSIPKVVNCTIVNNTSSGLECEGRGYAILKNCVISGNQRHGIYGDFAAVSNCTIAGNRCSGVFSRSCTIGNCIIWDNNSTQNREIVDLGISTVGYSCVQAGWPGEGNTDADPCFVVPGRWEANEVWVSGDCHIRLGSPCVNAGDPDYVPETAETDVEGGSRIAGGRIDIGAYEVRANHNKAWNPAPADGAEGIWSLYADVILTWLGGDEIGRRGRHFVYFGTNASAVANADQDSDEFKGINLVGEEQYNAGRFELWKTLYWRVDEGLDPSGEVVKGDLWRFTTGCVLIDGDANLDCVVDFKDFSAAADTWLQKQFFPDR
jgi:hypothetical protein